MAHFRTGCMVCGKPLRYLELPEQHECSYCHRVQVTNALCDDGHFVCDRCHSLGADDAIEQVLYPDKRDRSYPDGNYPDAESGCKYARS